MASTNGKRPGKIDPRQSRLIEADERTKGNGTIELDTPHDASLIAGAIERRVDGLEKLAKRAGDEGYPREARVVEGDAAHLRERILPKFKQQGEIPLAIGDTQSLVRGELGTWFWQKARWVSDAGDRAEANIRIEEVLELLARHVAEFGRACVDFGFAAGQAARERDSDALLTRAAKQLALDPEAGGVVDETVQ